VRVDGSRDVRFTPNTSSLSVGDELRCTARGNPAPEVSLSPATLLKETKFGAGWRSLVVQPDWVGRTLTVECSASNVVDGEKSSHSHSITFNVTGEPFSPVYSPVYLHEIGTRPGLVRSIESMRQIFHTDTQTRI